MMKRITLLMATIIFGFALNAQVIYIENFEAETAGNPPSNFTILNEDACTVNAPAVFTNGSFIVAQDADQGNVARAQSWTTPACQVDDWLITPSIDLTTAPAGVRLEWMGTSNPSYLEEYDVLLSTTGTAVADFTTTLLSITDEPDAWTAHSIDLTPYIGSTIHIAFNLISNNEDALSLDDITVFSPPANDLELNDVFITDGHAQTLPGYIPSHVVDFSKRNNVEFNVVFDNVGTDVADSVIIRSTISNADGSVETIVTDTFVNALASGASFTHTLAPVDFAVLFPALATDDPIFIEVALMESNSNSESKDADTAFNFIMSPLLSYTVPFEASFEIGAISHADFSWKYMDNDDDGNTFGSYAFTNIDAADGTNYVIGSIVDGSTISIGAADETLQSPEISLNAGSAYEFSIYASSFFNQTGVVDLELTDGSGASLASLGTINLTGADSTLAKFAFQTAITNTQADYMVNINKNAAGLVILDYLEIVELQMPTAPTVNNSWNACDSEAEVTFNVESGNTYTIDWGDGSAVETVTSSPATHTYATTGTMFTVTVDAANILGNADATTMVNAEALSAPNADFILNASPTVASVTTVETLPCNTYTWVYGDGSANGSGNSDSHTYAANGTYTITLLVENAAGTATSSQEMNVTTIAINEIDFVNGISVFPNPTSDVLNIAFELNNAQDVTIELVTIDGRTVSSITNSGTVVNETINTSNFASGMYILNVTTDEGKHTRNIMVK